ncbi:MAG TPA: ShlB/FhaC/HecB family hemolysin secretion/activation protein [Nevskiaceae bacterium]|nr:ShlB/FhaC/HecB family hemolysin secretion/activation protein [Nevskiaceae bacterium]
MPVLAPEPATPEQRPLPFLLESRAEAATLDAGRYRIALMGPRPVDEAALRDAVATAKDLSGALRAMTRCYVDAGYPAAKLWYALDGEMLYVLASLGRVEGTDVEPPLDAYFDDLPSGALKSADLEPRRILASEHANRAGLTARPVFRDGGDQQVLSLEAIDDSPDTLGLGAELHNRGNRFVGRHFLDVAGRLDFATGDELTAAWHHALKSLNDSRANRFNQYDAGWSRVTPIGLFGLSASYSSFDFDVATLTGPVAADGDLRQAELAWIKPLAATRDWRVTANAEVAYDHKKTTALDGDAVLQDQEYGSIEAGVAYSDGTSPGAPWGFSARLQARLGLGDDEGDDREVAADLGYFLARPSLAVTWSPDSDWVFGGEATVQWTGDTLPEQAQWVLGGVDAVTAYLPGVAIGDSGGLVRLEARREGEPDATWTVEPRLFVEHGWARFEAGDSTRQRLTDAGLGVTLRWRGLSASLVSAFDIAHDGVGREQRDDSEAHVVFSVAARL